MGAGESTRRLIVEDTIIDISDSAVRRLKGQLELEVQSIPNPKQSPPKQQQEKQGQQQKEQKDSKGKSKPEFKPSKEVYIDKPVYYPEPSQDSKKAIQEVAAFYQEKLKQLEAKNAQLQKITTEQFAKAVQEVEHKFLTHTGTPVCDDIQGKVYNCYSSNPKETLNCWKEVGAFTSCVERARLNALARRG